MPRLYRWQKSADEKRRCTKCHIEKTEEEFYHPKGGFSTRCILCHQLVLRENRKNRKEFAVRASAVAQ